MIIDITGKYEAKELDKASLPNHWQQYFIYEEDKILSDLTKEEFSNKIVSVKKEVQPYIDAQRLVSEILTELGTKHTFHRQFNEKHPDLQANRILGMQLYKIMLEDTDAWVYLETKHLGHEYPHATYSLSKT